MLELACIVIVDINQALGIPQCCFERSSENADDSAQLGHFGENNLSLIEETSLKPKKSPNFRDLVSIEKHR
jgi:hypothetical protein